MSKMKICKVCSKEVAKSAKACPNCGARLKMGIIKKLSIGIGIMFILIIIATAAGGNSSSTSSSAQNTQNTSKPEWNTTDTNTDSNGNMATAVNLIKSDKNLKSKATIPDPASVAKSPFKYYGKVVEITGEIGYIEDYPKGSDWSNSLGGNEAGQIVISSDDGTVTDMFLVRSTGDLKNGDTVTLYGYPIGLVTVDNKLGGKTTQLAIVGNSFDK